MSMKSFVRNALAVTLAMGLAVGARAQQEDPRNQAQAAIRRYYPRYDYDTWAEVEYLTYLDVPAKRLVPIHRIDPLANKLGLYYHRPTFALIERQNGPLEFHGVKLPLFVHGVDERDDGTVIITMRFQLTSPDIQQLCRKAVIAGDLDTVMQQLKENGVSREPQDVVSVGRWPIESVFVDCKRANSEEVIAAGYQRVITAEDSAFYLDFTFSRDSLTNFLELAKSNKLAFRPCYSYTGAKTVQATLSISGATSVGLKAISALTQPQIDGKAPIFQRKKDEVEQVMRIELIAVSRIEDPALMPQVDVMLPGLINQMFTAKKPLTLAEVTNLYPEAKQALAEYLLPDLIALQDAKQISDLTVETVQDGKRNTSKVGGGFFASYFGLVGISFDADDETVNEKLRKLEKQHGVTFSAVEGTKRKFASSIDVVTLAEGWDKVLTKMTSVTYLSLGDQKQYLIESDVPQQYTDKVIANQVAELKQQWEYDRVPLGTMLPYFGASKDPPVGYVWADGKSNWPDEPWVAEHLRWADDPSVAVELRGRPMPVPNMDGYVLAGGDMTHVGERAEGGVIAVAGTVSKDSVAIITAPSGQPKQVVALKGAVADDQDVFAEQRPHEPLLAVKSNGPPGQPRGQLKTHHVDIPTGDVNAMVSSDATVNGTGDLGNALPQHIKCRWIIRVR